jgi:hypothetical protein
VEIATFISYLARSLNYASDNNNKMPYISICRCSCIISIRGLHMPSPPFLHPLNNFSNAPLFDIICSISSPIPRENKVSMFMHLAYTHINLNYPGNYFAMLEIVLEDDVNKN